MVGQLAYLLHYSKKDIENAEKFYRRAMVANPDDVNTHCNLGMLLQRHRNAYEEAEAMHLRAIELDPSQRESLVMLGLLYAEVLQDNDRAQLM